MPPAFPLFPAETDPELLQLKILEILVEMPTIPPASWNATIVPLFSQPLIWIFGPVVT